MSDEMCPNPVTCPFVDSTEPHPVSDHPGMSDRRPEKLWTKDGDGWFVATPDEVLAELRRAVESGTIKGEVVEWCEVHGASVVKVLGGCGAEEPDKCRVERRVLLPPEPTYKTYTSAEGAEVTYAP